MRSRWAGWATCLLCAWLPWFGLGRVVAACPQHCSSPLPALSSQTCALLQRGWEVAAGRITFKPAADKEGGAPLPSLEIISHCLNYAREVERIV